MAPSSSIMPLAADAVARGLPSPAAAPDDAQDLRGPARAPAQEAPAEHLAAVPGHAGASPDPEPPHNKCKNHHEEHAEVRHHASPDDTDKEAAIGRALDEYLGFDNSE
eukprot:43437-Heterocapsa_arctica.AAC.1